MMSSAFRRFGGLAVCASARCLLCCCAALLPAAEARPARDGTDGQTDYSVNFDSTRLVGFRAHNTLQLPASP